MDIKKHVFGNEPVCSVCGCWGPAEEYTPCIPVEALAASTDTTKCVCRHEAVHHINHKGLCTAEGCDCMKLIKA